MSRTPDEMPVVDFRSDPDQYRHWRLRIEPPVAYLTLDVQESEGLFGDYILKQNSYDLGVDIELYDATQRLRFQHPEVRAVVIESGKERIFCGGANIGMLGAASHQHKVNFCKFTNETRLAIEDACRHSGQRYLCAVNGTAAGGGYEIALATDHILLADNGSSAVSLPEVPLLGVLPGTGGLTRLVDKRRVRRDRADVFCTLEEGVKGQRALRWGLVDELAPDPASPQWFKNVPWSWQRRVIGRPTSKALISLLCNGRSRSARSLTSTFESTSIGNPESPAFCCAARWNRPRQPAVNSPHWAPGSGPGTGPRTRRCPASHAFE